MAASLANSCNFCPFLGFSKLANNKTKLIYPQIQRKKEVMPDDLETRKRKVLDDLTKQGIKFIELKHEEDSKGKRMWICPLRECGPDCKKKFYTPEQVRDHIFKKKNIPRCQTKQPKYSLGNEIFTDDPEEATDIFINREFPEVLEYRNKSHDVIFAPSSYIFGPVTTQVITKKEGHQSLEPEKQKKLEIHQEDLEGQVVEETIFYKLKSTFKMLKAKNTVVISGWKVQGGKESKEFDFLIVNSDTRSIIHIESKKTYTQGTNAFEQVQKGYEFFNSNIPFFSGYNWEYCKVVYFENGWNATETDPCGNCKWHIIDPTTDLPEWWKHITSTLKKTRSTSEDPTYLNIVKYLFHQMYQQGDCITPNDQLQKTEENIKEMSTIENIFFWSKIQFDMLQEAIETRKVAFLSPFGTGKTTLLKEKARILLKKGETVVVIIFRNDAETNETLLYSSFKREFQDFGTNIQFYQKNTTDCNVVSEVENILTMNPNAHFFFDEVYTGINNGFPTKKLNEIAVTLPKETYFWIACQSEHPPGKEFLKGFLVPEMSLPLRYAAKNLEIAEKMKRTFGESSFPSEEISPNIYLNQGSRSLFLALTKDVHLACAVEQLAYILDRERAKTIIKIDFEMESIIPALKNSIIQKRLIFTDGTYEFLEPVNKDKILVVSSKDNNLIRGYEVPVLVHFASGIAGEQIQDIYSRCKSKLIIICNEEYAVKIVPSNAESNSAGIIQVYGELMPTLFEDAVRNSNTESLFGFLSNPRGRKVPIDSRNKASKTGLMIACQNGDADIVKEFLDRNADCGLIDARGWSPLHFAIVKGDPSVTSMLIDHIMKLGENKNLNKLILNMRTNGGKIAIHLASLMGHDEVLKQLIETKLFDVNDKIGDYDSNKFLKKTKEIVQTITSLLRIKIKISNLEKQKTGRTPLHLAYSNGHYSTAKLLLESGANPNILIEMKEPNNEWNTIWMSCLQISALQGNLELVKLVTDIGTDVNYQDVGNRSTSLHFAYQNGHLDIVKYLVKECSADVNLKDNFGKVPLHFASKNGDLDVVKCLVEECSAGVNLKNDDGYSPLHFASRFGQLKVVKYLVEEGKADVNLKNNYVESPLHLASQNGHLDVVKCLVEEGNADVNLKHKYGWSSLHFASRYGQLDVVKYLAEECCADVNLKDDEGCSPLHFVSRYGQLDVVKYLAEESNADVNMKNNEGDTPLHLASKKSYFYNRNNLYVVKYLVEECRADINMKNNKGQIPIDIARDNRDHDTEYYLSRVRC